MQKVLILIFLSIGFGLIFSFFISTNSPFDQSKLNNLIQQKQIKQDDWFSFDAELTKLRSSGQIYDYLSSNFYIAAFLALSCIFSIFSAVHLTADKLFFKNYYEKPSYYLAYRRGLILCASLFLVVYLSFYIITYWYLIIIPVIGILVDILIDLYLPQDKFRDEYNKFLEKIKELRSRPKTNH